MKLLFFVLSAVFTLNAHAQTPAQSSCEQWIQSVPAQALLNQPFKLFAQNLSNGSDEKTLLSGNQICKQLETPDASTCIAGDMNSAVNVITQALAKILGEIPGQKPLVTTTRGKDWVMIAMTAPAGASEASPASCETDNGYDPCAAAAAAQAQGCEQVCTDNGCYSSCDQAPNTAADNNSVSRLLFLQSCEN